MNKEPRLHIPKGFKLDYKSKDFFIVEYKRTGMIAMNLFTGFFILPWIGGCILLLFDVHSEQSYVTSSNILLLALLFGIIPLLFFLYYVFCKKRFQFNEERLVIKTKVLFYKTTKLFTRTNITQVKQIKDGGEGKDSFHSWGLNIMYRNKEVGIISRQPHEKSLWLGKIISSWTNVPFKSVPPN